MGLLAALEAGWALSRQASFTSRSSAPDSHRLPLQLTGHGPTTLTSWVTMAR